MSTKSKLILAILTALFYCHMAMGQQNCTKFHYECEAFHAEIYGEGQPVILIPGATCGGEEWNETVGYLQNNYQCHVLTIAGFAGLAPMSNGPYLEKVKNQIEQYITDKKLKNVILLGHSIGGMLSLWIASEMKGSLAKVVVVDAMPFFAAAQNPNASDTFSEAQAKGMYDRYEKMSNDDLKSNQLKVAKFMCLDSTRWEQIATWGAKSDKKTMAYAMTEMLGRDLRKPIANIQVPVLVLAAYSAMPEYPQFTRELVTDQYKDQYKACSKCTVHTAEGKTRHFIMYDNPVWFKRELNTFLQKKS